jgi:predicted DNA-binding transcriptional regulator YafY
MVDSRFDALIRAAILGRRRIACRYDRRERTVEPHDYGIKNGKVMLLVYQVAGGSASGKVPDWRCFVVDKIENLRALDEGFAGGRPVPGEHRTCDVLFLRVSPPEPSQPLPRASRQRPV